MLLARYDAQLRAETEVADADEAQRLGPLWMATFPKRARGFLSYQNLAGHDVDELIRGAIEHYAADERVDHSSGRPVATTGPPTCSSGWRPMASSSKSRRR